MVSYETNCIRTCVPAYLSTKCHLKCLDIECVGKDMLFHIPVSLVFFLALASCNIQVIRYTKQTPKSVYLFKLSDHISIYKDKNMF